MWKLIQAVVLVGLTVWFHELDRSMPMPLAIVLALGCTLIFFVPLVHVELWLAERRATRIGGGVSEGAQPSLP
jgi:hypothetical protein